MILEEVCLFTARYRHSLLQLHSLAAKFQTRSSSEQPRKPPSSPPSIKSLCINTRSLYLAVDGKLMREDTFEHLPRVIFNQFAALEINQPLVPRDRLVLTRSRRRIVYSSDGKFGFSFQIVGVTINYVNVFITFIVGASSIYLLRWFHLLIELQNNLRTITVTQHYCIRPYDLSRIIYFRIKKNPSDAIQVPSDIYQCLD